MQNVAKQLDPKVIVLLAVLVFGLGGYLFYMKDYKPAKVSLQGAQAASSTAQSALQQAQATLSQTHKTGPDNADFAKGMLAQEAIPQDPQEVEAEIEVQSIAKQSGVVVNSITPPQGSDDGSAGTTDDGTAGATPADAPPNQLTMTVAGYATMPEIMVFTQKLQENVQTLGTGSNAKVYVKGRLFSVSSVQLGTSTSTDGDSSSDASDGSGTTKKVPKGDQPFTITIVTYSRNASDATASSSGTTDATNGTAPADGSTDGSTTTDPNAAAGTTTAPAGTTDTSSGTTPAGTTDGTTPAGASSATTSAAPATGGSD